MSYSISLFVATVRVYQCCDSDEDPATSEYVPIRLSTILYYIYIVHVYRANTRYFPTTSGMDIDEIIDG